MNVCLISREFPPFFGGGIGTYSVQWARALAGAGHRVVVVTVSDSGERQVESGESVTIVRLPFIRGQNWSGPDPTVTTPQTIAAFSTFCAVSVFGMQVEKALPELCRQFKIDIIEAPDTGAASWFALNNRRTGGVWRDLPPIVTTIHSPTDWIAHYNRAPLRLRPHMELAAMERDCARWSDGLVSPSRALAAWSSGHWDIPSERIEVTPYPLGDLQPGAERAAAVAPAPKASEQFEVLFVGRLEPRKGVDTLLAAFVIAAEQNRRLTLTLAGQDTPHPSGAGRYGEQLLESLVPPALRGRVRILGKQTPAQLIALRSEASAVIVPPPMDNYPFTCIEAMAEGRLVIVSSGGGTSEMVREGIDGLVFAASDAAACAGALAKAADLSSEQRQRMGAQAARRILELCGNQLVVKRRVEHYARVIEQAATARRPRRDVQLAVINPGKATPEQVRRLISAVRESDADFSRGWLRTVDGRVLAASTPTLQSLSREPRAVGPIVASLAALERAGIAGKMTPVDLNGTRPADATPFEAQNAWALLLALTAAGVQGAVVHDVVFDINESDYHPEDKQVRRDLESSVAEVSRRLDAIQHELDTIHRSKGWKLLQRAYRILHVLRGRGGQGANGTTTIITQPVRVNTTADRTPTQ